MLKLRAYLVADGAEERNIAQNERKRRIAPLRLNVGALSFRVGHLCAGRRVTPAIAAMSETVNCFAVTYVLPPSSGSSAGEKVP